MESAQDVANALHNAGLSDGEIAELVDVSREYINKIRNGKKIASNYLTEDLNIMLKKMNDLSIDISEDTPPVQRSRAATDGSPDMETDEPIEIDPLVQWVFIAGVLVAIVIVSIWAVHSYKQHRKKEREDDNEQGR